MGIMGLLFKLALECVRILAWPLFAIAYPLCASIQAIESNSNSDTEKLITYWVCFSLILLFENAFQQLLHWLPYWPYIKLIIVGCLVTPHFDGSVYIYNHFVRPCLSMDPRFIFNWLIKLSEILKQDYPLTEAKKESKETETEALKNLISFKPVFKHHEVEQKDINAVEVTEKNGISGTKSVRQIEPDFALPSTATNARTVGGKDVLDLIASKKVQKECTCATSEVHLISKLQGKTHSDKSGKIKPLERNVISPSNSTETSSETSDSKSTQESWTCVLCKAKCTRKLDLISHFCGQRHANALESLKATPSSKFYFKPWTCGVCQVTLKNKNDLILHLQSKRHFTACENQKSGVSSGSSEQNNSNLLEGEAIMNLKSRSVPEFRDNKWWCSICNISCTGEQNMNLHLNGSKHLAKTLKLGDTLANGRPETREVTQWIQRLTEK